MSEDAMTQREHEEIAREVRHPGLVGEPEIDDEISAEVQEMIAAQMAGEEDGSS